VKVYPALSIPLTCTLLKKVFVLRKNSGAKLPLFHWARRKQLMRSGSRRHGADEAIQLSDRAFAGSDSWATAYTLALAIKKIGNFNIILCGKQAHWRRYRAGRTGHCQPARASLSSLMFLRLSSWNRRSSTITVERLLEEGRISWKPNLPASAHCGEGYQSSRAQPHFFTFARASSLSIPTWTVVDLPGVDPYRLGLKGSPTQVIKIFSPPKRRGSFGLD